VSIYIGQASISINMLFWAVSVLFFLAILRMDRQVQRMPLHRQIGVFAVFLICGRMGAYIHAFLHAEYAILFTSPDVQVTVQHGSAGTLGAYLGILSAYLVTRWLAIPSAPIRFTRIVLAMWVGGAVARTGCLFSGCCAGTAWNASAILLMNQAATNWPVLDLVITVSAIAVLYHLREKSDQLAALTSLGYYCIFRFIAEFMRPVHGAVMNLEQFISLAMFAAMVLLALRHHKRLELIDREDGKRPFQNLEHPCGDQ